MKTFEHRQLEVERLWAKVDRRETDECWPWLAALSTGGYGRVRFDGFLAQAHRVVYELEVGPIAEGAHLDHTCHNADPSCGGGPTCLHRRCVNPAHLEPVSPEENTARSPLKGGLWRRQLTHCHRGHEFTEANTYRHGGRRHCRACCAMRQHMRKDVA